jgi:hypothetical protein
MHFERMLARERLRVDGDAERSRELRVSDRRDRNFT